MGRNGIDNHLLRMAAAYKVWLAWLLQFKNYRARRRYIEFTKLYQQVDYLWADYLLAEDQENEIDSKLGRNEKKIQTAVSNQRINITQDF